MVKTSNLRHERERRASSITNTPKILPVESERMNNRLSSSKLSYCVAVLALAGISTIGCRKQVEAPAPAPAAQPVTDTPNRDSLERAEAARRDSLAREERLRAEREQRMREARTTLMQAVYFGYDRADLTPEARRALDAKLTLLAASEELRLRISGHADDRGSDEYNIALGQRRAVAAKRYLTDHGIDPMRLDVVSMGEERPVCTLADESCWRQNRRAEFEITAGGDRIVTQQ